jgi:hypothetical protein
MKQAQLKDVFRVCQLAIEYDDGRCLEMPGSSFIGAAAPSGGESLAVAVSPAISRSGIRADRLTEIEVTSL